MRCLIALLLATSLRAASTPDQQIDDLARRIHNLSEMETLVPRADTLVRAAALLATARPDLAAPFREKGLALLREHPEIARERGIVRLKEYTALAAAVRQKVEKDRLRPLAEQFLLAIEHSDENPDDYTYLAEVVRQNDLSTGVDNASIRVRLALAELAELVRNDYDFTLTTAGGEPLSLKEQRGKVVLLSFWATWCAPCREELPIFERLLREHRDNLEILAITDEPLGTVRGFIAKNPLGFPVLHDPDRKVATHYKVNALPSNKILDATGRLRGDVGAVHEDQLRKLLSTAGLAPPATR